MNTNIFDNEKLDKLLKRADDYIKRGNINVVIINEHKLICFQDGTIIRLKQSGNHKLIPNVDNMLGYNVVNCNGKIYLRHRIIAYSFLKLDIDNVKSFVDHIDQDKLNNNINNLRVVTNQQNTFNTKAKGYYWDKQANKFHAQIRFNKVINLGLFDTADEAHNAYLQAKLIYHIISLIS